MDDFMLKLILKQLSNLLFTKEIKLFTLKTK